jgi:hypothetical protein
MFRLWQQENPGENPRVLAQHALNAIHGVDLNPYAVAIARFRLLLAALQVCGITKLKNAPDFTIHLASGDSLLHGRRFRESEGESRRQTLFDSDEDVFRDELAHHYEVEDTEALHRILGQQYHAVVANPPYITVKDSALSDLYRMRYPSCYRQYSLSVPFMERIFDLAVQGDGTTRKDAGFTGQITGNTFMKREFGKLLIEKLLPQLDLTHVVDTSGAYIPGHGTPTVILFGKNQPPVSNEIRTVLGIRGEPAPPDDPSKGHVWQAVVSQIDEAGSESEWLSASDSPRINFLKHPWSIGGGGIADLKDLVESAAEITLGQSVEEIGYGAVTREDEAFVMPRDVLLRHSIQTQNLKTFIEGETVRDWQFVDPRFSVWPYDEKTLGAIEEQNHIRFLWPNRASLSSRVAYGMTQIQRGLRWFEYSMFFRDRFINPLTISFAEIATHNNFTFECNPCVFSQTAPVIKPNPETTSVDFIRLVGILNSSIACFWLKQVSFPKGGSGIGRGIQSELWEGRFAFDGTKIKQLPLIQDSKRPQQLPTALVKYSEAMHSHLPSSALKDWTESGKAREALASARETWTSHRRKLIAWQEELDWQVYEAYGLIESTDRVSLPEGEVMDAILPEGLELGQRAFEIVLARRMVAGEVQTTWFTRHGSTPITEIPTHWPAAYQELVERRIRRIESDSNIRLIEQPEYKRRWNTESWESQFQRAATEWLLLRLETYFHGSERMKAEVGNQESEVGSQRAEVGGQRTEIGTETPAGSSSTIQHSPFNIQNFSFIAASRPHLVSAQQLAEVVQADPLFLEVAECLEGNSGFTVSALVQRLVEAESVPALPRDRYKDSGLRKREDWEATWELQRQEDAVEAEVRDQNPEAREEELKKMIRKAQLERVGEIAVPPKYGSGDFKKASYWKLRGKLDVPKERWICYPGAERDGDTSPVIAWAGWDHFQQAQALAEYFLDAKDAHGWPPAKLKPLLAALADLLPWLKQWHNAFDPNYGMGLGDYFQGFLEEQCRALEMTVQEVDAVRFEVAEPSTRKPARKQAKKRGRKGADDGGELPLAAASGHWQDQVFALLAPKRKKLTHYRMLVWPELLRQMPGDLEFETFRKAYWLLSEPAELEKLGRGVFPDVPVSWWRGRSEQVAKDEFLTTLKGSVTLGEVRIWKEDDVRFVRWHGAAGSGDFPEALDDARIALQLATLWTEEEPDPVRESMERELVLLETT